MDNLDTSDVLLNRGLNGGYGYGRQGREFADDASNAVRINSSEKLALQGHSFLSQQVSDNADRNRDTLRSLDSNNSFERVIDKMTDQSRFFSSELNQVQREASANARAMAECCCEAKLEAAKNQAKTDAGLATILANQECASKVADAVANATQNAKLDLLLSERSHGHHAGN